MRYCEISDGRIVLKKSTRKRLWLLRRTPADRWAYWQLRRRGVTDYVARRPAEAIAPDYPDLWALYRLVREKKPRVVLEFGSGCSTIALAHALRRNGGGKLYSVETSPRWLAHTADSLGDLRPHVELTHSGCVQELFHGTRVFRHTTIPDIAPDVIYLDGPVLTADCSAAIDPLLYESRMAPGAIILVDCRRANVALLERWLQRAYRIQRQGGRWGTTRFELLA